MAKLTYRILKPEDYKPAQELYGNSMADCIGWTALGFTKDLGVKMSQSFLKAALANGLSIGAFNNETGEIVGVRFVKILNRNEPKKVFDMTDQAQRLEGHMDHVNNVSWKDIDKFEDEENILKFVGLTVSKKYRKQGVANKLIDETIKTARENGYKIIIGETGITQVKRIYESFGFEIKNSISFKDFMYDGEQIYSQEVHHLSYSVYKLKL